MTLMLCLIVFFCVAKTENASEIKVLVKSGIMLKKSGQSFMGYRSINTVKMITAVKKPGFEEPRDVNIMKEAAEISVVRMVTNCINLWDRMREELFTKMRNFEDSRVEILKAVHVNASIEEHAKNRTSTPRRKRGTDLENGELLRALYAEYRFDKKVATRIEQLKSGISSEFWSLACKIEINEYRAVEMENLHSYTEQIDKLLELALMGLREGRLTPKFLEPDMLRQYVLNHTAFSGTVFREHPQYLYQVARIKLTDFEVNDEEVILEYDWEFPVIQESDIRDIYESEQVGFRKPGGHFNAEYEVPGEIVMFGSDWIDARKLCKGKSNICHAGLQGRKDVRSCLQPDKNFCLAKPSNISEDSFINTRIGALINTVHGVKIKYHNGREEVTSGGTEFISWVVAESIVIANSNTTLRKPDEAEEREAHIIDQEIVYTTDLNFSISVPFSDLDEKGLHAKLWTLKGSIDKVENTMKSSPFVVNVKLIIIIAVAVIVSLPIMIMLCKFIVRKIISSRRTSRGGNRKPIMVPSMSEK